MAGNCGKKEEALFVVDLQTLASEKSHNAWLINRRCMFEAVSGSADQGLEFLKRQARGWTSDEVSRRLTDVGQRGKSKLPSLCTEIHKALVDCRFNVIVRCKDDCSVVIRVKNDLLIGPDVELVQRSNNMRKRKERIALVRALAE